MQRTRADTCREVSTLDVAHNSTVRDARDTRDENENVDVLPLNSLIDIDNPNDTKVSELADKHRADETSGAFEFAKLSKSDSFLKMAFCFTGRRVLIISSSD